MVIKWSPLALQQYTSILAYWDERNQSTYYSDKLDSLVEQYEQILLANPYLGHPTIYGTTRAIVIYKKYSIFYRIDEEDTIRILLFWDGRQNPEKLTELLI